MACCIRCSTCYNLQPAGYPAGIYTLTRDSGKVVWLDPDSNTIKVQGLIDALEADFEESKEVDCPSSSVAPVETSTIESRELCITYYDAAGVATKAYGVGVFKLTESATDLLRVETRSGQELTEGTGAGEYQIAPSSDCDCDSEIL